MMFSLHILYAPESYFGVCFCFAGNIWMILAELFAVFLFQGNSFPHGFSGWLDVVSIRHCCMAQNTKNTFLFSRKSNITAGFSYFVVQILFCASLQKNCNLRAKTALVSRCVQISISNIIGWELSLSYNIRTFVKWRPHTGTESEM